MKKFVKTMLKVLGIYAILDVLALAFIGAAEIHEEIQNNPGQNAIDSDVNVLERSVTKIKNYYKK